MKAASGLRATAGTMQPRTLQVQVCTIEANDAAVHSPLGNMATGDHPAQAETAAKLQAVEDKLGKHQADAKATSEADQTMGEDGRQQSEVTQGTTAALGKNQPAVDTRELQALQMRENLSLEETRVKVSQASLEPADLLKASELWTAHLRVP
jgi:hypothetical protein